MNDNDIAIIGMAARVPGAQSAAEFWNNLVSGVESIEFPSREELLAAGESPEKLSRPNYVRATAPLPLMEHFDAEFFGFSPKEAAILDPQHRQFFECAWEALEDAGHMPERFKGPIGVFAGAGMGSYFYFNLCSNPHLVESVGMFLLRHTGNDKDFLSTRLSFLLDLRGPSVNVQTACSTSLVAVHLACQSLLSGECDMALAGGVTIDLPHRRGYLYHENEILSPDGHCHAFDARAQGTVFGSGAGVVVLRRLKDALEAGDNIVAVIRGSAVNNDGASKAGYLAPSVDGQAAAISEALALAGVDADSLGYVECHGTGTYLGDPIEVSALTLAHRQTTSRRQYCRIGSVKTNIGHLDTAAGVVSLIKAALCVREGLIPPSLNYDKPNPSIDFESSPFVVNSKLYRWEPKDGPRRAAVNSLGVGGTNAHVVLEQPPAPPAPAPSARFHLLQLSARSRPALDAMSDRLAEHLERHPEQDLADVCFTLREGRRAFAQRRVLAVGTRAEAIELLRSRDPRRVFNHVAAASAPGLVFMFPGGGVQYADMAHGLYTSEEVFRRWVDQGFEYLRGKVEFDPKQVLFPSISGGEAAVARAEELLRRPGVQLPLLFIVEYALAQLLISKGVTPAALIGHSMGENTAACVAQVLGFGDALGLVTLRGKLFDTVPTAGMLSVAMPEAALRAELGDELDLACVNAPELCVASGPKRALERLSERLTAAGVEVKPIPIDIAAHSRMLDGILPEFRAYLRSIKLSPPKIPFISNRSGTWITDAEATDPEYWVGHLRHTVQFFKGIDELSRDAARLLIEVGPGSVLGSLAKQHPKANPQAIINTLRHPKETTDDAAFFLSVMGRLWGAGRPLDTDQLFPDQKRRRRVSLPTYAFQRERYWIDPGAGAQQDRSATLEPSRIADVERWFYRAVWRREDLSELPPETPASWLVFADGDGLADRVSARLRSLGHTVITVRAGDAFYRSGDSEYVLPPEHGRDGYEALVRDLIASGRVPSRVLHAWCWADRESFRPGSTFFHRNLELGFYSLLFFAQALAGENYPTPLHISVLTTGAECVEGEAVPYPEQAAVLGPCKVIPRELPGVTVSTVDLPRPGGQGREAQRALGALVLGGVETLVQRGRWGRFAGQNGMSNGAGGNGHGHGGHGSELLADVDRALMSELFATAQSRQVAIRGGVRWKLDYERLRLEKQPSLLRSKGVYLITGGFGGIGLSLATHLCKKYAARLVLIARQPLPARDEWSAWLASHPGDPLSERIRAVRALEEAGGEVLPLAADVTDVQAMADAVSDAEQRFGRIDGVFHAAGIVSDAPLLAKREMDAEATFAAKLHGTRVLWDTLRRSGGSEPPFLVLFSSTSTAIAAAGQVDYVAANSFLNAFAAALRHEGVRALSLNWGIWNEVGMALEAASQMGLAPESRSEIPARHPWFRGVSRHGGGATLTLELDTAKHWVLDEHRTTAGLAILPGTAYIELIRAALAELGEAREFRIRELYFFRPLHVPDDALTRARVRLEPSGTGYSVEVQSQPANAAPSEWDTNAQAQVSFVDLRPASKLDLREIERRCPRAAEGREGRTLRSPQEAHLRFGPRWRVLEAMQFGPGEALATLALPLEFAGDLTDIGLHPALLDLATGYAMSLIQGYDSEQPQHLWVPVRYHSIRVHAPLSARLKSWVKNRGANASDAEFASFDVVITNEAGDVLCEVEDFTIKKLSDPEFAQTRAASLGSIEGAAPPRELSARERAFQHNLSLGITPAEGARALELLLSARCPHQVYATSIDLGELIRQTDALSLQRTEEAAKFSRPKLESTYIEPRDDIERTLVEIWEDLLGVDKVGVQDSFFDLGGHSLIAVRLFARLKKQYHVDYPISVLFEAPTIEACANLFRKAGAGKSSEVTPASSQVQPKLRFRHLVAMHPSTSTEDTPFFLVAGMFGNVLNLRQLANLIGADRPFYGLQARGLFGDDKPHETFEDMAKDYLAEIKQVQPHGPYLLGGFSGGGIVAYEMARQLAEQGEPVPLLVMLDTPIPSDTPLTIEEKLELHVQNLRHEGLSYPANWVKRKFEYKRELEGKAEELSRQERGPGHGEQSFHSRVIEAAFYRALERYQVRPQARDIKLFRPRLRPVHQFSNGSMIDMHRRRIYGDNGWGRYVRDVEVFEMPGDHDNMVLEPNVRILAAHLRRSIEAARSAMQKTAEAAAARAPSREAERPAVPA